MRVYAVKQGDFLASIAWAHGVDEDAIWNHPANAELKKSRSSPNVLYSGDVLYIPDAKPSRFKLAVGSNNAFETLVPTTTLRVAFADNGVPWANASYRIEGIVGLTHEGSTDGEGVATFDVPVDCGSLYVSFPGRSRRFRFDVGHLDPVSEPSGIRARLQHLGYLRPIAPGDGDAMSRAVRAFQADSGLEVTGELTGDTLVSLAERYGS